MKEIVVKAGVRKIILIEFNTNYDVIRNALRFLTNTDLAKQIRAKALELGGVEKKTTQEKNENN